MLGPHSRAPAPAFHGAGPVLGPSNGGLVPNTLGGDPAVGSHTAGQVPSPENGMPGSHGGVPVPGSHGGVSMPGSHGGVSVAGSHGGVPVPGSHGGVSTVESPRWSPHSGVCVQGSHGGVSMAGSHGGIPLPGSHDGVPVPVSHGGVPVPYCHGGDPEHGSHSGEQMARSHTMGPFPCPSGRGVQPRGQMVTDYPGAGVMTSGGPQSSSHDNRQVMYPPTLAYHSPAPMLDHRGLPYADLRRHSYHGMQYSSFGTSMDPASRYEQGVYRPPANMQVYPECRAGASYAGFIVRGEQQQQQVSPECGPVGQNSLPITTKVEPDTDRWEDGDILDRLEQVRLQADEPPACREYTKPRRKRR